MTTQHTPGPWHLLDRLENDKDKMHRYVIMQDAGTNEIIARTVREYESVNDLANARLIAAAPELLAALESCDAAMSAIAVGHAPPAAFNNILLDARAAIAKATGAPVQPSTFTLQPSHR